MKVVIVGGGIVGLSAAYAVQRMLGAEVIVCEKEAVAGSHQSTHNSGVLHAGLYYAPGSLKARLAVRGIRLMTAFARRHGVPTEICGKIVVATRADEVLRLRALHERGTANGLTDLAWLGPEEVLEREPHVRALAALHVPEEGIVDYGGVVAALHREIEQIGGRVLLRAPVTAAIRDGRSWRIHAGEHELHSDVVINCAGLYCDRVSRLFGAAPATRIVPFRGDYFTLARPELVRHLVYPVPDPAFPFLGVHFTRMIGGGVECGPTAVLSLDREGYGHNDLRLFDAIETLTFRGLWNFVRRHPKAAWHEMRRAHSKSLFLSSLRRLIPEVNGEDLRPGPSGVRAQAMRPDGTLVQDFEFLVGPGAIHLLNAPSPGATAALAIGEEIVNRVASLVGSSRQLKSLDTIT